jgi:predicted  nucleic acid-binding Zn-ribbon protein
VSGAADGGRRVEVSRSWPRLERASREAASALTAWRRRALEAEDEVARLRRSLEELASGTDEGASDHREELRRLRAENTALHSRMQQARKRVAGLMKRLMTLGIES